MILLPPPQHSSLRSHSLNIKLAMHFVSKADIVSVCLLELPDCMYYATVYETILHDRQQGYHSGAQEDQSEITTIK